MQRRASWQRISFHAVRALLPLVVGLMSMAQVLAAPAESQGLSIEGSSPFEDPVEPLTPLKPRSQLEEDHVQALALFAAARVAEQKQNYAEALRNYQRAFRFDPDALAALREIVPLAFNLDREESGVRYALLMAERDPTDANLLRRLAMYLTDNGETERALRLYEKALALQAKSDKPAAESVLMWMEIGRLYFLDKDYTRSAENFAKVVAALEKPKEYGLSDEVQKALVNRGELTYQLFGESFLEAKRPDDAAAAFAKAAEFKSDEALTLYNDARVEAGRQRYAQALAKLEKYLEKKSASQGTGPYELYAKMLEAIGQEDQLLARLERFRAADPDNIPLGYFVAEEYRKGGEPEKARPILEAVLAARPQRPPVEAVSGLADMYRRAGETQKLLKHLGETVGGAGSLSPLGDAGDALIADRAAAEALVAEALKQLAASGVAKPKADAAEKAEEDSPDDEESAEETPAEDAGEEQEDEAESDAGKSDEDKPLDYGTLMAAALVALEIENYDAADTLFEAALEAEGVKPAETLVTWGLELFTAQQFERAIKVFRRGIEAKALPKGNPALEFYLAGALEMAGQTDAALEQAAEATRISPDSPRFASRKAWILFHAGRLDEARASYLALLNEYDKNYESAEARDVLRDARLVLSNIAIMQGDQEQGEEWLEQVLDEFPEDAGALNDLGYLWADAGKHLERARIMIEQAVADDPKNMAYRDSLGWVLYRLGRFPEAVAELKVAAAVPEADGLIFDHLAEAQLLNGEIAGAIESWRSAAAAYERDGEPDKALEIQEKIKVAEAQATEKVAVPEPEPAPEDPVAPGVE